MVLLAVLLVAFGLIAGSGSAPPVDSDPVIYDLENYDEGLWDLNNYVDGYDYEEVSSPTITQLECLENMNVKNNLLKIFIYSFLEYKFLPF